jgi:hypothetical protein
VKADIGIGPNGRPYLEIVAESMSEATLLKHFGKQLGLDFEETIGAPPRAYLAAKETTTP